MIQQKELNVREIYVVRKEPGVYVKAHFMSMFNAGFEQRQTHYRFKNIETKRTFVLRSLETILPTVKPDDFVEIAREVYSTRIPGNELRVKERGSIWKVWKVAGAHNHILFLTDSGKPERRLHIHALDVNKVKIVEKPIDLSVLFQEGPR